MSSVVEDHRTSIDTCTVDSDQEKRIRENQLKVIGLLQKQ